MVAMSPQLPCIWRQQALSSSVIALFVIHASKGAAVERRRKTARRLARRRILKSIIDQVGGAL
jgi:hypothetical protein